MALASGLSAQLGFKQETTWGTAVTVDTFTPFLSETLKQEIEWIESKGIVAGALMPNQSLATQGRIKVLGDVQMELNDRSMKTLLYHCLGSISTTGTTAPYVSTITTASLFGKGLTVQIGRPDRTGTVQPFTYAGMKVDSWQIACKAAEIATAGFTLVGKSETTNTALASASFVSPLPAPMTGAYSGGSFQLAGSTLCVREVKVGGKNNLNVDRRCLGSRYIDEPLEMAYRDITGEISIEFPDLYHYNRYVAGTRGQFTFTLANQDNSATAVFSGNVRTQGAPINVQSTDVLVSTMTFKCERTNSDAGAFSIVYTSSDATP